MLQEDDAKWMPSEDEERPFFLQSNDDDNPSDVRQQIAENKAFSLKHICLLLLARVMIDFAFKNPLIFYENYSAGSSITDMQFAYILVSSELGCIAAMFFGDINLKYLKTYTNIITMYLIISGISSTIYVASILMDNKALTILWCCICRFVVGLSFSFISASSKMCAIQYKGNMDISTILAILHYSWPLSITLNIMAGYIIDDIKWIYVFIISGTLLIVCGVVLYILFNVVFVQEEQQQQNVQETTDNNSQYVDNHDHVVNNRSLSIILTDKNSLLIIFSSFAMTFRERTRYIVTSSLWMEDIFNLSATAVGWETLSVIFAQISAITIVLLVTHKYALWKSAITPLSLQLFFGILLFLLSLIYGNSIGPYYDLSMLFALMIIFAFAMTHQAFYIVQNTNAIKYAPKGLSFLLLLSERMSQETSSLIAVLITSTIWQNAFQHAIIVWSIIWIIATLVQSQVLLLYTDKNQKSN
eukprot:69272_1